MKSIDTMLCCISCTCPLWILISESCLALLTAEYEFSTVDKGSLIRYQEALVGYLIGPQCVAKHEKNTDQICAILLQEQR